MDRKRRPGLVPGYAWLLGRGWPTANQPGAAAEEDLRFSQRLVWLTLAPY
jgi:hypothetical protein